MIDYDDFKVILKRLFIITVIASIVSIVVILPLIGYIWMLSVILIFLFLLIGFVITWVLYQFIPDHAMFMEFELDLYKKIFGGAKRNESVAKREESYRKRNRYR
jgi:hypothetical protein